MVRTIVFCLLGAVSYVALFAWPYGFYMYTPITSFWGDMLYAAFGGGLAAYAWTSGKVNVVLETLFFGGCFVLFLVFVAVIATTCLGVPDKFFDRVFYLWLIASFHRGVVLFLTTR